MKDLKQIIALGLLLSAGGITKADSLTWDPSHSGGSGGAGTWNLNSTLNWWNGSADVTWKDNSSLGTNSAIFPNTGGTVTLNTSLSASNLQFTASGYALSGSGTLTLGAGGIDASALSSGTTTLGTALSLSGGQQLWQVGSGGTLAVNGVVTRAAGATVDFSATGVTSSSLANANGILGGWATVGGANTAGGDWAANDGSGNIIAYTGYTQVTGNQSGAGASAQNWENSGGTASLTANATINSLNQLNDFTVNAGATLTLGGGGLILGNVSRWLLEGSPTTSFLTTGTGSGELFVHVPDAGSGNNWTIWPIIADNGATPLIFVKDGVGLVKLGNMNTYTGGTIVNAGTLCSTAGAEYGQGNAPLGIITPFGYGSITINNGAQLQLGSNPGNTFGEYDYTNNLTLNNGIVYEADAFHHLKGTLTIASGGGTLGATYDNKGDALNAGFAKGLFVDGLLAGTGNLAVQNSGIETVNPWDSSTVYFTSTGTAAQNTYSGTVTVNSWSSQGGSYLYLIGTNALANATVDVEGDNNASSGRFGSPALLFGSGTNLDGVGYATIGGLAGTGDFVLANTKVTQSGSSLGAPVALTVGNNNSSSTYSGVMSGTGSLTKVGSGTLTLASANTYTGDTTVNGGKLVLFTGSLNATNVTVGAGATLDISALGTVTLTANQTLISGGTVNGTLNTSAGTKTYAGTDGGYGTNAITGSLTLAAGATVYFDVGLTTNGANDRLTVAGTLTANNNVIHIKAPGAGSSLQANDYTLVTSPATISGSFASAPSWDVAPANAGNFSIVTSGTSVKLHYTAASGPTGAGTATPAIAVRNQNVFVSVRATNGNVGTVNSAVLDATAIGGANNIALVAAGGNVWTNTVTVVAGISAGGKSLAVTLSDTASLVGVVNIPLSVIVGNDVWNGAGANDNFSSNLNWTNHLAPGLAGDSLEFAGTTRLTPNMDNSYTITSINFDSGAGGFTIGTGNSSTLTLGGAFVNNSTNTQTLNVPVTFTGAQTVNAAAGNISLNGAISGSSSLLKTGAGALTLSATGNSFGGILGITGGTLNVTGGSTAFGTGLSYAGYEASSGTLNISGGSFSTGDELWVGGSDLNGTANNAFGNMTVSGGANVALSKLTIARGNNSQNTVSGLVTLNSGTLSSENDVLMGFAGAGNAKLVVNGGTLSVATATKRWVIVSQWDSTSSELDINNGQMNINANTDIRFAIGGNSGTNIVSLNGGAINFYTDNATTIGGSGVIDLHQGNSATVVNIFNLNGGTLTVSGITSANTAGNRFFNFNGGTLKAPAANAAFMNLGAGNAFANVRNGGAIIDDGGFGIEIDQALVHSTVAGDNATDGGLTKLGAGTLTLGGAATYTGNTLVNAGTLALTGSGAISVSPNINVSAGTTFDVSALGSFTLGGSQTLLGSGTNNGTILTSVGSKIYAGTDGTYGTNTFNGSLTLASGTACYFDLGTIYNRTNDQIVVNGTLTASGNTIHIKAPSTASAFDSTADYVLISSTSPISGTFATGPVWDVPPANAGHYTVVTSGNAVTLHYNAVAAPLVTASARPATLLRNQSTVITANVLPGSSAISTVTVDLSPVGGSLVSLVQSNTSTLYTNSATIPATMSAGGVTLTVTATDTSSRSGLAGVPLTIVNSTEIWGGAGGNPNWSTNPNWASGFGPGYAGDTLLFAGSLGLAPNMDNNYSATGLSFSNNAASFTIGTANSSTLTLTANGIVNNSANAQAVNVPLNLTGAETVNAASGNISLGSTLADSSLLTVAGVSNTAISGVISGASITKSGNGTLTMNATGNAFTGNFTVIGGTLNVNGGSAVFGSSLCYAGYDANGGNLSIGGGSSVTTGGELWVGGSDQNGSQNTAFGTLTVSGGANVSLGKLSVARGNWFDNTVSGTVTINSGVVSAENDLLLGFAGAGTGKVVINGGTLNIATATKRWVIMSQWDTANAEIDVNSGQMNINANTDIRYAINGNTGTNTFNLNGGAVTFYSDNATTIGGSGVVDLHQGNGSTVVNTFNLNGGTLTVSGVTAANGSGTRTFNFNGGTLKATATNAAFLTLGAGSAAANVRNGGATVDDGGFPIGISQSLLHSGIAGDNATDGGLTKLGAGTLTLGSANSYNGNTTVKAGTLELVLATLAVNSTVSISNAAVLQLDFATTNRVAGLILNGVSQASGVYNHTTSPTYLTGTGSLLVQSIASNPTNITFGVSGSTLSLSWPTDHLGWILQSQTNILGAGLGTNWVDVPGSAAVTSTNMPVVRANPTVFYRLRHP